MTDGAQENAMTEIALAMAMGFFSIMVLTALSMGVHAPASAVSARSIATAMIADSGAAPNGARVDRLTEKDTLVVFDGQEFFDRNLKPLDPAAVDRSRRVVLAVAPNLTMDQTLQARRKFAVEKLVITTLDANWRRALRDRHRAL